MTETKALFLRYPLVFLTLLAALVTFGLVLSPYSDSAIWMGGGFALAIAARSALSMARTLRTGAWGIDVLAIAAIVSTVLLGDYWAALIVVLMITSGEALEDYASRRARHELRTLMDRAPRMAHRQQPGSTFDIPVEQIAIDDMLEVRPGEVVPVDGEILEGEASLDESSITGESLPRLHRSGETVLSGAVNGGKVFRMRATATAGESQYQTIVSMVEAAADSKAPFVRIADRVAIPFTALAFVIATLAWALSNEPSRFAQVMVVATPCPLLIAAPVAFIAGMSRAAGAGAIVKAGGILEQVSRVRAVAFDKTGTLTRGTPSVRRVETATSEEHLVLAAAAAIEADSTHVLARAVTDEAERRGIVASEASEVEEVISQGVRGRIGDHLFAVGKLAFAAPTATSQWEAIRAGEMAIYVGRDGSLIGRIVLADALRPETPATLSRLRQLGVSRVAMLTGDSRETAAAVGVQAGIDDVKSELLAADKVAAVRQIGPRPTMMIGDGVNDAPVLAAADIGVAMGARGATAASESADVVIMLDDLMKVTTVVEIAQRTIRIARQSIWLGTGLSIALMLIASFGALPAVAGAGLQEAVDVIAILNSLRAARAARVSSDVRPLGRPWHHATTTESNHR